MKAASGSLFASSKILFGIVLGAIIFSERPTVRMLTGGGLIILSLIAVSVKEAAGKKNEES